MLLYAPLTEEPAKWLPLLLPFIRSELRKENAAAFALAVGLGFGVGEICFLANQLGRVPEIAALPFWHLGGFISERALVCLLHGCFIAFIYQHAGRGAEPPGRAR